MRHKIHFVCRGNVYRSRLAEAIFKRIGGKDVIVSSSGIETWRLNLIEPTHIRPDLVTVCKALGIIDYFSHRRTQTTNELLAEADLIIFLDHDVYMDALMKFDFNRDKATVWRIPDILENADHMGLNPRSHKNQQLIFRKTARKIQRLCEQLEHDVNRLSWTDIVDENNGKRGFSLPISWACRKGLWWRGCHVVVTTPSGKYLVEKRSRTIVFAPGLIDITLGGGIDSGESPLTAARRETEEEIGLSLPAERFQLIDTRKWDSYHPRYGTVTRIFLYTYHCKLDTDSPDIKLQRSEVAAVGSLSQRQLSRLLRYHHLRHLGRLKTGYKYFETVVTATKSLTNEAV